MNVAILMTRAPARARFWIKSRKPPQLSQSYAPGRPRRYRQFRLPNLNLERADRRPQNSGESIDAATIADQGGSDMNAAVTSVANNYFAGLEAEKAVVVLTDGMVVRAEISNQQTLDNLQKATRFFTRLSLKPIRLRDASPRRRQ
jgi:hypothetical protein